MNPTMPDTLIVGFEQFGHKLYNDTITFIKETNQPETPTLASHIYLQAVVQCFSILQVGVDAYISTLYNRVPDWRTIDHADVEVNPRTDQGFIKYASAIQAFGACLHHHMTQKGLIQAGYYYGVESANSTMAVVKVHLQPNQF